MKERFNSTFQVLRMTVWRRKYFLLSGCLMWGIFYLYLHSAEVPESLSFTSDGTSVKHPIDNEIQKPRPKDWKNNEDGGKGNKFVFRSDSQLPTKYSSHYRHMTEEEIRKHKLNEELEKEKHSHKWAVKRGSTLIKSKTALQEVVNVTVTQEIKKQTYIPSIRLVHFDLKGAPPKISFFKSIFPVLRNAGANGILMEYEDTFPFWGPLSSIASSNAYDKKQIRYILELARNNDLNVIPLVQTFGHLEFVLKLPEFKHLREVDDVPQSICPTNNGTLVMVKMMIDQIMSLHSDSKWLHIGCDEVYQLGHCSRCSRYDRNSLFLAYVRKVAKYVREQHNVTPIIWDDMLRHTTIAEMEKYEMGKLVEPMAWSYVEDIYIFLPSSLWEKYSQVFPYMWTASAYKGAFGETLTVPDAKRHLENNKGWLNVMREQNSSFHGFRGIALTGWQRYDHFASLCELLPAAFPSLILNLLTVSQGHFNKDVFPKMQELLECSSRIHYHLDLEHDPNLWRALGVCFFPGSPVFRLTLRHNDVAKSLDKFIDDVSKHKGWMTEYNLNHNFSSPLRVNELLKDFIYYNSSLQNLQDAAVKALREMYDDDTVSEWIELNIHPYVKQMKEIWDQGIRLKKFNTWPRRPLPKVVKLPPPPVIDLNFLAS